MSRFASLKTILPSVDHHNSMTATDPIREQTDDLLWIITTVRLPMTQSESNSKQLSKLTEINCQEYHDSQQKLVGGGIDCYILKDLI